MLEGFATWADVLAFCRGLTEGTAYRSLWYHAPLDHKPRAVRVVRVFKNGKVRIDPMSSDADSFTMDAGHLNRCRKLAPRVTCSNLL